MQDIFLDIKHLTVEYRTDLETVHAVNDISFSVRKGETLGLVGETGAGKTSTALAILRLLPEVTGHVECEQMLLEDKDIMSFTPAELRAMRGKKISMIFQDPMTALNPVLTVGDQIAEAITFHDLSISKEEVEKRVDEVLTLVGISPQRKKDYPHQFSGGMKQRVIIAVAGMEGARASVIGGLTDCPLIAVPTSIGYGASFGGLAALLAMLNSCASGSCVVNIDNGFGAGFLADRINRMESPKKER